MITAPDITPGVYGMPMAEYHAAPGASKSQLDLLHQSPALVQWAKAAPEDDEAESAVDVGSALHTLLLEPDQFDREYVRAFEAPPGALFTIADLKAELARRSIPFKAAMSRGDLAALLLSVIPNAPVHEALVAEWERGVGARTVLTAAEHRKLTLMRDSVMAHPTARPLLEREGHTERCHFWNDKETGELCRCRIDREVPDFQAVVDIKTTATMDRFEKSIAKYRYHVQEVFYCEGYAGTQGNPPAVFVFIAVSTTRDRKRYPVRLFHVTDADRDVARRAIRDDLAVWAECRRSGVWHGIETISVPPWV